MAHNAELHQRKILDCTRAIAFLGTPHRGSHLASWASIAGNMVGLFKQTAINTLNTLHPNSEVLEIITHEFQTMLRSREQSKPGNMKITCYAEELPVQKLGKTFMVCRYPIVLHKLYYS